MVYFNEPIISFGGSIKREVDEVAMKNELRIWIAGFDSKNLERGSMNIAFLIRYMDGNS